jgi:hypothetical protein
MALGRLIERRADNLGLYQALHVRVFIRSLIYLNDIHYDIGLISGDTFGDILELLCIAVSWSCDYKPSLTLTDWSYQIHYPGGIVV